MHKKKLPLGKHEIMTYSYGKGDKVLMLVHGGPGVPSIYLQDSHKHFVDEGYRVVTWDQLGCGESDKPKDSKLWRIDRYVEELEAVRDGLGLGKIYLLGHSWGGVLALEYCLRFPDYVKAFIACDTSFDLPRMQRGFERKKLALGEITYTMMAKREAEESIAHPEYQAAVTLLMRRHMCRAEQWSDALVKSLDTVGKPAFEQMFGRYFFNCTGSLRDYNRINDLPEMKVPTLLIHGEHDYIIPECASMARDNLPQAELALFRNCSHMPFYEDPEKYTQVLIEFLKRY